MVSFTANFLRIGHTHEDIDQLFSRLARHIRKCTVLETIDDFVKTISNWCADKLHRPFESRRYVWKLDNTRHWKPWLQKMLKVVTGIGGPTAPHVFHFKRVEGSFFCLSYGPYGEGKGGRRRRGEDEEERGGGRRATLKEEGGVEEEQQQLPRLYESLLSDLPPGHRLRAECPREPFVALMAKQFMQDACYKDQMVYLQRSDLDRLGSPLPTGYVLFLLVSIRRGSRMRPPPPPPPPHPPSPPRPPPPLPGTGAPGP